MNRGGSFNRGGGADAVAVDGEEAGSERPSTGDFLFRVTYKEKP